MQSFSHYEFPSPAPGRNRNSLSQPALQRQCCHVTWTPRSDAPARLFHWRAASGNREALRAAAVRRGEAELSEQSSGAGPGGGTHAGRARLWCEPRCLCWRQEHLYPEPLKERGASSKSDSLAPAEFVICIVVLNKFLFS